MKPGEEINSQLDALEMKIELLMKYLGLKFEYFNEWSDEPTGIGQAKRRKNEREGHKKDTSNAA